MLCVMNLIEIVLSIFIFGVGLLGLYRSTLLCEQFLNQALVEHQILIQGG